MPSEGAKHHNWMQTIKNGWVEKWVFECRLELKKSLYRRSSFQENACGDRKYDFDDGTSFVLTAKDALYLQ